MRGPFQVLIIPYMTSRLGVIRYAALKRRNSAIWQAVTGCGKCGEYPLRAAVRETREELGIAGISHFIQLSSIASIPAYHFSDRTDWPQDTFVVPEYSFGLELESDKLLASNGHLDVLWGDYVSTTGQYLWDSNRIALWELHARLTKLKF